MEENFLNIFMKLLLSYCGFKFQALYFIRTIQELNSQNLTPGQGGFFNREKQLCVMNPGKDLNYRAETPYQIHINLLEKR